MQNRVRHWLESAQDLFAALRAMVPTRRRRRLWRTDYGRSEGWEVYVGATKVAELLRPNFDDMFWYTYELVHIDLRYEQRLKTIDFWYEDQSIRFKSKALGEFAPNPAIMIVVNLESPGRNQVWARRLWLE